MVRNEVHWHSAYMRAFERAGLTIHRCMEPEFTPDVLDAFVSKGGTPSLRALLGLPYVLAWECSKA